MAGIEFGVLKKSETPMHPPPATLKNIFLGYVSTVQLMHA